MGFFRAAHGWAKGGAKRHSLPKICHTFPKMMKLGTVIPSLKKDPKNIKSLDTPLEFCIHQHFLTGNNKFFYIKKNKYRLQFHT